jgi:hypothetical protein
MTAQHFRGRHSNLLRKRRFATWHIRCLRLPCLEERDWDCDRKTAVAFTGAADVALTAGVLHGRTRQMKGKL